MGFGIKVTYCSTEIYDGGAERNPRDSRLALEALKYADGDFSIRASKLEFYREITELSLEFPASNPDPKIPLPLNLNKLVAMMESLEKWLRHREIVMLKMHARLGAESFYRKLGYVDIKFDDKSIQERYVDLGKNYNIPINLYFSGTSICVGTYVNCSNTQTNKEYLCKIMTRCVQQAWCLLRKSNER